MTDIRFERLLISRREDSLQGYAVIETEVGLHIIVRLRAASIRDHPWIHGRSIDG